MRRLGRNKADAEPEFPVLNDERHHAASPKKRHVVTGNQRGFSVEGFEQDSELPFFAAAHEQNVALRSVGRIGILPNEDLSAGARFIACDLLERAGDPAIAEDAQRDGIRGTGECRRPFHVLRELIQIRGLYIAFRRLWRALRRKYEPRRHDRQDDEKPIDSHRCRDSIRWRMREGPASAEKKRQP